MTSPAARSKRRIRAIWARRTSSTSAPMKSVGRIYQQTFMDTYSKVAFAKLYAPKTPIISADLLNDHVLPFFAEHEVQVLHVLTDRDTAFCGKLGQNDYQLYLAINGIEHIRTKVASPQTKASASASTKRACRSSTR